MAEQVLSGTGTILVAEDFEDLLELAYEILSSWGYRVILANDGQDAVRLFKTNAEDIQLVVLDVVMPRLGGVGAIFLPKPCMPEALCRTVLSTLRKRLSTRPFNRGFRPGPPPRGLTCWVRRKIEDA